MQTKYDELARLAEAATPGKWVAMRDVVRVGTRNLARVTAAASLPSGLDLDLDLDRARDNARYIAAANPTTIKALLAERDALAEALEQMVESLSPHAWGSETNRADALSDARAALARVKGGT